jgi:hypothetical protein
LRELMKTAYDNFHTIFFNLFAQILQYNLSK